MVEVALTMPPGRSESWESEVLPFRKTAINNNFRLVRVVTGQKRPIGQWWQCGESDEELLQTSPNAMNTGLILDGLRAIDIDVDDVSAVEELTKILAAYLPSGGLVRRRQNSPRMAVLYRAALGAPSKRVIEFEGGKVEVLGKGQQLVVHGLHPSGSHLYWDGCASPASVKLEDLAPVTESQISAFFLAVGNAFSPQKDRNLTDWEPCTRRDLNKFVNDELSAGIEPLKWFDLLDGESKKSVVATCLAALDNRSDDPRERWLSALFGVADADNSGCPDARELALQWSKAGKNWTNEGDFDVAWSSWRPGKTSIGSLLRMAQEAGADVSKWRDIVLSASGPTAYAGVAAIDLRNKLRGAIHVSQLPEVPPKRQWLQGVDLVRGAVSLLVAPGGRGKSAWLIALALACASGKYLLGSHIFGGPLRVLYINAEESYDELALRFRAAMQHHGLSVSDMLGLSIAGAENVSLTLLKAERSGPVLDPSGWEGLKKQIAEHRPDIIILDPLVALTGGVTLNDNAAAAIMMRQFVSIAADNKLAVMIAHHTAKNTDHGSADAAMGAASLVNLARICLALEPLKEGDASKLGVPPWDAKFIFRVIPTKQNLAPANATDRWFRIVSVDMPNAAPPVYPNGDAVGVVEEFKPSVAAIPFPQEMLDAVIKLIGSASPALSPSLKSSESAVPKVAAAIGEFRGGCARDSEAKAVLDYLTRSGRVVISITKVNRPGRGPYERQCYAVSASPNVSSAS